MVAALVGPVDAAAASVSMSLALTEADRRTVWADDAFQELVGIQERGERSVLTDLGGQPEDHPVQKLRPTADGRRVWLQVSCRRPPAADGDLLLSEVTDIARRPLSTLLDSLGA